MINRAETSWYFRGREQGNEQLNMFLKISAGNFPGCPSGCGPALTFTYSSPRDFSIHPLANFNCRVLKFSSFSDGGTVSFENVNFEAFGTDGDVRLPVIRAGSCAHPCQVTWEANDDTAVRGKHYRAGKGSLSFEPGEDRYDEKIFPAASACSRSGDVFSMFCTKRILWKIYCLRCMQQAQQLRSQKTTFVFCSTIRTTVLFSSS